VRRFKYKAKDTQGNIVVGEVEASNEKIAAKLIRDRNLTIITITPISEFSINFFKKIKNRASFSDAVEFTRQLATMINAGLPITEALLILRSQSKGAMQEIVTQVLSDVEEGMALSKALEKYPSVFSKTYIALVKSGELGGVLSEVLERLSENLERQQEFRGRIKSAMVYPAIIIFGMGGVSAIMVVFVIPKLTELYEQFGAELPFATKVLLMISGVLSKPQLWPFAIIIFAVMFYGFRFYRRSTGGRRKIDELLLKVPLIGGLNKQIILTDITRTLSLMVGSGVSVIEGLQVSSEVVSNVVIADALKDAAHLVEKGFPVAFSFSRHPEAFPFILSQMVAVGEETGKMDEVLQKVSHVFEVESDQKLKALTSAIEPIILIVLGIGVAFLVISIIMPIYNLTTKI